MSCGHTFHTECIGPWAAMWGPNSSIYKCQVPVAGPNFMVMPPVEGESTEPHIEGESTPVPEDVDREMEDLIARSVEETYALASEASGSSDSSSSGS